MTPDLRRGFDALVATATGTLAGILVDSGFGVRLSIVNAVYRLLGPVFDIFSAYPIGQLTLAGFIYRMPLVLIVGLLVGLFLRHFRFPRLLLCSILVWPVCLAGRRLASALLRLIGDEASAGSPAFPPIDFVPGLVIYSLQYALLILVVHTTAAMLARSARRKAAPAA